MSTRPFARFNGPGHQLDALAAAPGPTTGAAPIENLARPRVVPPQPSAAERAATRARVRDLALDVIRGHGEVYSAELAAELGCSCSHAKSLLIGLELRGAVSSEHRETTVSGHGRRYYRLRKAMP